MRLTRVDGWIVDSDSSLLQHVQQGGLSGVIEAKKEDFCTLMVEPCFV